jgi:predicted oxidoreductase
MDLKRGNTKSCGCLRDEGIAKVNYKHGAASNKNLTGAYRSWRTMKDRCYNEDNNRFYAYGARGIKVCDRWRNSFENFIADMNERPEEHTLDRINVNADYSPENCRWASNFEQARNQRTNVWYQVGSEQMIQADVARALGVHPSQVLDMRRKGVLPPHIQTLTT